MLSNLTVKTTRFFAFDREGTRYQWAFWKGRYGWMLRDHEGHVRVLEGTWFDSVPRIRMILENYGLRAEVS